MVVLSSRSDFHSRNLLHFVVRSWTLVQGTENSLPMYILVAGLLATIIHVHHTMAAK